jgi:beta-galactosidase
MREPRAECDAQRSRVRLCRSGLRLGNRVVPIYAGSVHYWRLLPETWRAALVEAKNLGLTLIDTYVPWAVHEQERGVFDFGSRDPALDLGAFLRLVHELGLFAIVRPGPHVNGELSQFGLPERVVWDPACQATSPAGHPVMLPMVPVGFPVPSYASEAFLLEVDGWFAEVARELAPLRYPEGPIVLCQIDNEGTFYFRDGLYDQDYRPEALALYRSYLGTKYGDDAELSRAYGPSRVPFDEVTPPHAFDAETADDLAFHLDWAEFQEHLIATSLARMNASLVRHGFADIPTFHNMTMGYEATPLSAARLGLAVDFVGLDYYHRATPNERLAIERRTTELVTRCEAMDQPSFACEMGAGLPPFFHPIPDETDNRFTVLTALAYGLRAFNVYMAVERDRWIGAPIDARGRPRPSAQFWRKLCAGLTAVGFHELVRHADVRLVVPALKRRLTRAMHAFSPATPALFAVLGRSSRESCFEEDTGLGGAVLDEVEDYLECFEAALHARGVAFAHADSDTLEASVAGARWVICPTAGGVDPASWQTLLTLAASGVRITVGPRVPTRDGTLRPLDVALDASLFDLFPGGSARPYFDTGAAAARVAELVDQLSLRQVSVAPATIAATLHHDASGRERVLFVINAGTQPEQARIGLPTDLAATDLLDASRYECKNGHLSLPVAARSVRMLALTPVR